jgi:hypothetical protein
MWLLGELVSIKDEVAAVLLLSLIGFRTLFLLPTLKCAD